MTIKEKLIAWYDAHVSAGFYKAASWLSSVVGALVVLGPDAVQALLSNWSVVEAVPLMSAEAKANWLLGITLLNIFVLKPLQQKSTRMATLKQAAKTGQIASDRGTDLVQINVAGEPAEFVSPKAPS